MFIRAMILYAVLCLVGFAWALSGLYAARGAPGPGPGPAGFGCKGAIYGHCICVQTIAPAAVLGYNATDDRQSVMVNVVCVNRDSGFVSYYQVRKEDGLGGQYNSIQVPHD